RNALEQNELSHRSWIPAQKRRGNDDLRSAPSIPQSPNSHHTSFTHIISFVRKIEYDHARKIFHEKLKTGVR
ncbi:MAG: hypothetical protein WAW37_16730, partial [Syntrophobacteraceae bacterium]